MNSNTPKGKMTRSEAGRLGALKSKSYFNWLKQQNIENYMQHPIRCLQCNKVLSYENRTNKFCSHSCAAAFTNKGRTKPINRFCEFCGKPISKLKPNGTKFCSMKCSSDFRIADNLKKLDEYIAKTGEFPKGNGQTTSSEANRVLVRKYLETKLGHKCSICGNTVWQGQPIPLIVDHIDGNSSNCKVENFRLVCGNCDMQLETYKGRNKGNGRTWRKKYS